MEKDILHNKSKDQLIKLIVDLQNELASKVVVDDFKDHFPSLMQQSPSVIEIYDLTGLQIAVNKAYEKLWGFPASTTVNIFNLLKSKEVANTGLIDYINRAYNGESVKVPEYSFNPKGATEARGVGRLRWLSTSIYPLKDADGNVINIVITHEDITDRKEFETELKRSLTREKVQADIVRNSPMAIAFGYPDGSLKNCNPAFIELTGYTENELQDIKWNDVLTPSKWNEIEQKELEKLSPQNNIVKYEKEYIHKNGKIIPIELVVSAAFDNDNNIIHFTGFISDITDRKKATQELVESEEKFRSIFESKLLGIFFWNADGDIIESNQTFLNIVGYTKEEILNKLIRWKDMTPPEYAERDIELLKELAEVGVISPIEKEYYHKDGHRIPIIIGAATMPGYTNQGVAFVVDNTKQIIAEKESEKLRSTLELAQKMANVGVWSVNIETQKSKWSDQMYIILGCKKEDGPLSYADYQKISHPKDLEIFDKALQDCINGNPYNIITRIIFPDNSIHYVNTQGFPRYNENNQLIELFGTSIDITYLKETENELRDHKNNLESIVKQRTKELELKNKELDEAMKIFVGRELTIRELQNRLSALDSD